MEGPLRLFPLLALLLAGARAEEEATFAAATHDTATAATAASSAGTITGTRTNCKVVPAVVGKANLAATEVALFCRRGLRPGEPCCSAVVSYVDVAGFCRVSTEPQFILARINASRVLALYAACQGSSIHTSPSPRLNLSTSTGASPPAIPAVAVSPPAAHGLLLSLSGCDTIGLASNLFSNCNISRQVQTPGCCAAIVSTVDKQCLCSVKDESKFVSYLSVSFVWTNYRICGGRQRTVPADVSRCSSSASPPPPPASSPPASRHRHHQSRAVKKGLVIGAIIAGVVLCAAVVVAVVVFFGKKRVERRNARQAPENQERVDAYLNARKERARNRA